MAGHKNHDYHILPPSVWPFVGAVGGIVMLGGAVLWFHDHGPWIRSSASCSCSTPCGPGGRT